MIIRVAFFDLPTVARGRGRIYITGTTTERERARVWMGPQSYRSLRDAIREDGHVWCDVPPEQVVKPRKRTRQRHHVTAGWSAGPAQPASAGHGEAEDPETDDCEDEDDLQSYDNSIVEVAVYEENFLTGEKAAGFKDFDDYLDWIARRDGLLCTLLRPEGTITLLGDGRGGVSIAGAWNGLEGPLTLADALQRLADAGGFESEVDFVTASWGAGDVATLMAPHLDYGEFQINDLPWSGTDPIEPRYIEDLVLATSTWELTGVPSPGGDESGVAVLLRIGPGYVVYQCHGGDTIRDVWDAPNDEAAVQKFKVGFGPPPARNTRER